MFTLFSFSLKWIHCLTKRIPSSWPENQTWNKRSEFLTYQNDSGSLCFYNKFPRVEFSVVWILTCTHSFFGDTWDKITMLLFPFSLVFLYKERPYWIYTTYNYTILYNIWYSQLTVKLFKMVAIGYGLILSYLILESINSSPLQKTAQMVWIHLVCSISSQIRWINSQRTTWLLLR